MADTSHHIAFAKLRELKVGELQESSKLKNAVLQKTLAFQPGQFHDAECERFARLFVALVEDVLARRYGDISLRAFTHACGALDYLLNPHDELADSAPGGLEDDAKKLRETHRDFRPEFDAYEKWRKQLSGASTPF